MGCHRRHSSPVSKSSGCAVQHSGKCCQLSDDGRRVAHHPGLNHSRPLFQREVYPIDRDNIPYQKEVYPDSQCDQLHHDYNFLTSDSCHPSSLGPSLFGVHDANQAPIFVGNEGNCPPPTSQEWG
eukprot:4031285-Karenia_brevis.AAC.1